MAWDAGAIVVLVNAGTGVAHGARIVPQKPQYTTELPCPRGDTGMPDRQAAQAL
jgi:hypothetical protein